MQCLGSFVVLLYSGAPILWSSPLEHILTYSGLTCSALPDKILWSPKLCREESLRTIFPSPFQVHKQPKFTHPEEYPPRALLPEFTSHCFLIWAQIIKGVALQPMFSNTCYSSSCSGLNFSISICLLCREGTLFKFPLLQGFRAMGGFHVQCKGLWSLIS